jgi:hypothetical protein
MDSFYIAPMKKTILAPLLSAFVLPGLGQVINRQFIKAGVLMAAVMMFFLTLVFKVIYDLNKVILNLPAGTLENNPRPLETVALALSQNDKTVLILLLLGLVAIWTYGICDAFIGARKNEGGRS